MSAVLRLPLLSLLLTVCMGLGWSTAAAAETLRGVEQRAEGDDLLLVVTLERPFSIKRHFPRRRGRILQLQIVPEDGSPPKTRERLRPDRSGPLVEVIYEGNVRGGPFLVLRFAANLSFEVLGEGGPARRELRIRLLETRLPEETETPATATAEPTVTDRAEALYRQARAALTQGENARAVLLFTELLALEANPFSREALEYLGLARERNGQAEMAREIYRRYLQRYPESPRAETVRQRLFALETRLGGRASPRRLRNARSQAASPVRRDHFGRVYQLLYNAYIEPESGQAEQARRLSLTYLDFSARRRSRASQWRSVFSGSYEYDFLAADVPPGEFRLRSAYLDYQGKANGLDFSLGRQSVRSGGVLGRFDGARFAYRLHRALRLNGVAGAPVDYLDPQRIQRERPLVGVGFALEEPRPHWNANAYLIQQRADGLLDRRAIGGDIRYFADQRSAFAIIDYDLAFRSVNIATLHLGHGLGPRTRLSLHLDHRRSPLLTTSNALLGITDIPDTEYAVLGLSSAEQLQAVKADLRLATLARYLDEGAIRDRALANTGRSDLFSLGVIHQLGDKTQLNGNLNWSRNVNVTPILTTEALRAVGSPPPETVTQDLSVNAQLILRDYLVARDMWLLSAKLGDTSVYRIASASAIARRPLGPAWRLEARVRVEYTQRKAGEGWRAGKVSPALKIDYRLNKRLAMDGELGVDWYKTQQPNGDYRWRFFNLGLQMNF